ncbi:oligosaccharide flippase family protein [Calditrichota bacterium GD2]
MSNLLKKIAKNSAIYSLGNVSSKLVGFILLPIYTQYLTISDYGILTILEISGQFLSSVLSMGLYFSLNRWYWDPDYREKQDILFFNVVSALMVVGLSILFILFLSADGLSQLLFSSHDYTYYIRLLLFSVFLNIISRAVLNLMRIQEKALLYSIANLIRFSVNLLLTVYFVAGLKRNVAGIYEAQVCGFIIFFVVIAKYLFQNLKIKFDFPLFKEMFIFGFPMIFTSISGIILSLTDRYSLRFLSTMGEVGVYSFGFKISNSLKVFLGQSIIWALTPIMYKVMKDASARQFYSKTLNYFTFLLTLAVLIISLFSREIIELIAMDPEYYRAYQIVPIVAYAILFDLLKNVSAIGINIAKKTRTTAIIITFVALFNIGLNFILIPHYQAVGAGIATLISQFIAFAAITWFGQKYFTIPYEYGKLSLMIILGAGILVISTLFNNYILVHRLIIKTALSMTFPLILIVTGVIKPKNLALFKNQ